MYVNLVEVIWSSSRKYFPDLVNSGPISVCSNYVESLFYLEINKRKTNRNTNDFIEIDLKLKII